MTAKINERFCGRFSKIERMMKYVNCREDKHIGYRTTYSGHTLVWKDGLLRSFDSITYKYSRNKKRIEKTVDGIKHVYKYDGKKLIAEAWENNLLVPIYDSEHSVCGIIYNGQPFYFVKDLQGDVAFIVDSFDRIVARYTCDAWGNILEAEDDSDVGIGYINPFIYRGYYYDSEIGMYYVDNRYYDPEKGLFISPKNGFPC